MRISRTPAERHPAMSWAQRLKPVFGIEIETGERCGGQVRLLASIEDPTVIGQILGHLASRELPAGSRPPSRGPPQGELELPYGRRTPPPGSGSRRRGSPAARVAVCGAQIRWHRGELAARGSARRAPGQPGGRGGRHPGLADSAYGVFEMPIPQLHFHVLREGAVVLDETFLDAVSAMAMLRDHVFDLGDWTAGLQGDLDLRFSLDVIASRPGDAFYMNFVATTVPAPPGLLLLGTALAGLWPAHLVRRRRAHARLGLN